jgi:hypothetical protein
MSWRILAWVYGAAFFAVLVLAIPLVRVLVRSLRPLGLRLNDRANREAVTA